MKKLIRIFYLFLYSIVGYFSAVFIVLLVYSIFNCNTSDKNKQHARAMLKADSINWQKQLHK